MRSFIATFTMLLFLGALPAFAQEGAGQAAPQGPGAAGPEEGAGGQVGAAEGADVEQGVPAQTAQERQLLQEDAAQTDVPPVRGAETTPAPGQGDVAGQDVQEPGLGQPEADIGETDRQPAPGDPAGRTGQAEIAGEEPVGGAMPTTASALPILLIGGGVLALGGLGLRLLRR